jgi:DNA-binding CsgD family transcriptional regulator
MWRKLRVGARLSWYSEGMKNPGSQRENARGPTGQERGKQMASMTTQPSELTLRQREIVIAIADGCSQKEIAAALGITVKTVEYYRNAIKARTGAKSTAAIVRYAIRTGLIQA